MDILIHSRKFWLKKPTYSIAIDGIDRYQVKYRGSTMQFYCGEELQQSVTFFSKGWFSRYWCLKFNSGIEGFIKTVSWTRGHYNGIISDFTYEFYSHSAYRVSVYADNKQIAWWDKGNGSILRADYYKITADSNVNAIVLIVACLLIGDWTVDDSTISFGNLLSGHPHFDETWTPN